MTNHYTIDTPDGPKRFVPHEDFVAVQKLRDDWCKQFTEQRDDAEALVKRCAALEVALRQIMTLGSDSNTDAGVYELARDALGISE